DYSLGTRLALPPSPCPASPCWPTKVSREGSDNDLRHDARWEELLRLHVAMGDALLIGVERHLLPCRPVLIDAVRKEIAAEKIAHAARVGREPRHWIA